MKLLAARVPEPGPVRILDVGTSVFTLLAREALGVTVDTLDLPGAVHLVRGYSSGKGTGSDFVFDLNDVGRRESCPDLPTYDVVLLCEVVEHLRVPPAQVLAFLRHFIDDDGCLIVQTPNAVAAGA